MFESSSAGGDSVGGGGASTSSEAAPAVVRGGPGSSHVGPRVGPQRLGHHGTRTRRVTEGPALLRVSVFTSDFHAARTHAAMDWALGLEPAPGKQYGSRIDFEVNLAGQPSQIKAQ